MSRRRGGGVQSKRTEVLAELEGVESATLLGAEGHAGTWKELTQNVSLHAPLLPLQRGDGTVRHAARRPRAHVARQPRPSHTRLPRDMRHAAFGAV